MTSSDIRLPVTPDIVSQHDVSKCEISASMVRKSTSMVSVVLLKRCQTYSMYTYTLVPVHTPKAQTDGV